METSPCRDLRRRNGWTQAELASRLGTDPVTVSRWERGVSTPRPSALKRLRELAAPLPPSAGSLVAVLGRSVDGVRRHAQHVADLSEEDEKRLVEALEEATLANAMRRRLLLAHPARAQTFAADPTARLEEVERSRKEQLALKGRMRRQP